MGSPKTQHKLRSNSNHPAITSIVPPKTACHIPHGADNHTQHNTTITSQAFWPPTNNATNFTTTVHSSATVLVTHLLGLFHPVINTVVAPNTAGQIPHDAENQTQHNNTDTSQAPQPPTDDTSPFITTEHSKITALVAHLQCLHHLLPTVYITMAIFTQPFWLDLWPMLQPFTKANTHKIAPPAPNPPTISAAASSQRNSPTSHHCNNMSKPPSPPHKTQCTTQNMTSSHKTMMMTTMAVKWTNHLKLPYDWQEFPRPPEMLPTSSKKTSLHAMHPTTTMMMMMMMMMVTMVMMTTTADVKQTQHSKIPYDWNEHSKIPYDWNEFPRPTELSYYLPHMDIYCTASLRRNSEMPQPHSTNTCITQHAMAHCIQPSYHTTDYSKIAQ